MKKTKIIFAALLIAGGSLLYSSCQKQNMVSPQGNNNSSLRAAKDEALIDHQSTFIDAVVQAVTFDVGTEGIKILPACAMVTYDTTGDIKTATVDFGTTPCLTDNEENQYRQGILIITWTGKMIDPGTVKTVTTQN